MNKLLFIFLINLLFLAESQAQFSRYLVQFKDKSATTYSLANPLPYLSQRAIDRRTRYNIPVDSTDLPVPSSYISQIKNIPNVVVLNISRWLNAVAIQTNDANALAAINALSFIKNTSAIAARPATDEKDKLRDEIIPLKKTGRRQAEIKSDYFDYGANSFNEIHLHKGEFLHNIGMRGQGMQIAMLDGGYFNYTSLKAFDSVNANAQILSTWDFVAGNASVAEDNTHGMQCFSTIAANIPGQFIGKAPKANFHLFRTEDVSSEYPIEEFNWACGAERADSSGSDIISSSLGYGYGFNDPVADYPYSDLNGDITMSARAADLAAKKGLLVFNAAGNSGTDYWQKITTPADGDSVVAVGAVNTAGVVGSFSSYGPSADGRIKPDVASVGVSAMIQVANNTIGASNGTSYACPNMAGLATCLWQGFPEFNNMRIVRALKEAGSIYSSPDNRIGYGIPDLKKAFVSLLIEYSTSSVTVNNCKATLNWTSKDVLAMKYEIERKTPADPGFTKVGALNPQDGTVLANHSYQFENTLTNGLTGNFSYRIRQIIDTATAAIFDDAYIDTATVNVTSGCFPASTGNPDPNEILVIVQPNPATGSNAAVVIETPYAVTNMPIVVYDTKGRLVVQLIKSKGTGRTTIDMPVDKLPKGKYYIKVLNGQKTIGTAEMIRL